LIPIPLFFKKEGVPEKLKNLYKKNCQKIGALEREVGGKSPSIGKQGMGAVCIGRASQLGHRLPLGFFARLSF
jgi:hypothetical protein